jgi:hypothetical protein
MSVLTKAKTCLRRGLMTGLLCVVFGFVTTGRAGTPRQAQIGGALEGFLSGVMYSALTGWDRPSSNKLPQRDCQSTDIQRLISYSNEYKPELAQELSRECRFVQELSTKDHGDIIDFQMKINVSKRYCNILSEIISRAFSDIRSLSRRPLNLVVLIYSIEIPDKVGNVRMYLDASLIYPIIDAVSMSYACRDNSLFISAIYK